MTAPDSRAGNPARVFSPRFHQTPRARAEYDARFTYTLCGIGWRLRAVHVQNGSRSSAAAAHPFSLASSPTGVSTCDRRGEASLLGFWGDFARHGVFLA